MILIFKINKDSIDLKLIKPLLVVTKNICVDKNKLLNKLMEWLETEKVKTNQLETVAVMYSPTSFSLLRAVTSIANTLAWSLNIPVYKIKSKDASDLELAKALKAKIKGKTSTSFIIPEYYKEPNITKAK
jgi:tRNA A37 threonylcarbamoyladenosine modification protein TsaB